MAVWSFDRFSFPDFSGSNALSNGARLKLTEGFGPLKIDLVKNRRRAHDNKLRLANKIPFCFLHQNYFFTFSIVFKMISFALNPLPPLSRFAAAR